MFFIVSKIISFVLSPLIWIIAMMLWALITKKPGKRKKLLIIDLIMLLVFTNSFLVGLMTSAWDWKGTDATKINKVYKAGIVLGGNTISFNPLLSKMTYNYNNDRLMQALELYKDGIIEKIIVTGAAGNLIYRDIKEGNLMRDALLKMGVPDSAVWVDTEAENTHQNAVFVQKILREKKITDTCLLITSSLHMRRAAGCFNKLKIPVKPYATNLLRHEAPLTLDYLFFPYAVNITIWEGMTHEVLGYYVYKLLGYI
jgi:uncharacterized SAM-binding protein YcdF (DUF218 family)